MSDSLKKRADEQAKAREALHKKAEERIAKTQERLGATTAGELAGERDRLAGESAAIERAIWPYTGLYPAPADARLHVIPAGMWRYEIPITPALESMMPPSDDADPNAAIIELMESGGYMVDTQADDPETQARAKRAEERTKAAEEAGQIPPAAQREAARREQHREPRAHQ